MSQLVPHAAIRFQSLNEQIYTASSTTPVQQLLFNRTHVCVSRNLSRSTTVLSFANLRRARIAHWPSHASGSKALKLRWSIIMRLVAMLLVPRTASPVRVLQHQKTDLQDESGNKCNELWPVDRSWSDANIQLLRSYGQARSAAKPRKSGIEYSLVPA